MANANHRCPHALERVDRRYHCTTCGYTWAQRPQSGCPGVIALRYYPSGVLTARQLQRLGLTVHGEPDAVVWRYRQHRPIPAFSIARIREQPLPWQRRALALRTQRHDLCELCLFPMRYKGWPLVEGKRLCDDCAWLKGYRRVSDEQWARRAEESLQRKIRFWLIPDHFRVTPLLYPLLQLRAAELEAWLQDHQTRRMVAQLEAVVGAQPERVAQFDTSNRSDEERKRLVELRAALAVLKIPEETTSCSLRTSLVAVAEYLDLREAVDNPFSNVTSIVYDASLLNWFAVWLHQRLRCVSNVETADEVVLARRAHEWAALATWYVDARIDARAWLTKAP